MQKTNSLTLTLTMMLHSKLFPVKMCGLAHTIEQAELPWPGLPPYSNSAGESLMGIIPLW